jgi:hypothetical protein
MSAIATPVGAIAPPASDPQPETGRQARTGCPSGDCAKRHLAAVARTLQWADESAERGDVLDAIAWLKTLEAIGDTLPEAYEIRRDFWRAQLRRTGTVDNAGRGTRAA